MWDLAVWMVSLGLLIGVVFPPFTVLLGIPAAQAFRWAFVTACLVAGALVGVANHALARAVVGGRLRLLSDRLRVVDGALREATLTGNWSACNPDLCRLEVDSRDEIGESAAAFNRLVEALGRSHEVEEAMRSFADTLAEHLEIEALTAHALEQVLSRTVFDAGAVLATEGGELMVACTQGIQHAERLANSVAVRTALVEDRTILVDVPDDVVVDGVVVDFRPRLVYVAPISFRGAEMGVLILASNREVAPETEHLIEMFRRSLGVALKNALAHDDLQRLAALDPLTGLYNRRFGMERLAEEYARAVRSDTPFGVLMFDIDHFKPVNDTYGHLTGDRIIRQVARAAERVLRQGDVVVRYGGEEFLVLLPSASGRDVGDLAERVRRAVAETATQDGDQSITVTVSVGGAAYPDLAIGGHDGLVHAADEALYTSKAQGRNRVTVASGRSRPAVVADAR